MLHRNKLVLTPYSIVENLDEEGEFDIYSVCLTPRGELNEYFLFEFILLSLSYLYDSNSCSVLLFCFFLESE